MAETDLTVKLSLIDNLSNQLKEINNQISGQTSDMKSSFGALSGAVQKVGESMAAMGAVIVAQMTLITKSFVDTGTQLTELSETLGMTTEQLSQWGYVAEQNGTTLDSLANHIVYLSRSITDVSGGSGVAQKALADLGLSLTQLQSMSPEQQFRTVTEAIAAQSSSTERLALATSIFGRGAMDLMPILAQGTAGINAEMQQANALGIVMGTQDAASAQSFSRSLTDLKDSFKGLADVIGPIITSILQPLIEKITAIVENIRVWTQAHPALTKVLTELAGALGIVLVVIGGLLAIVPFIIAAWSALNLLFVATPLGWLVLAIGAVVAAGVLLIANWDQVKNGLMEFGDYIKIFFADVVESVNDHFIKPILNGIAALMDGIANVVGVFNGAWAASIRTAAGSVRDSTASWDKWAQSIKDTSLQSINNIDAQTKDKKAIDDTAQSINNQANSLNSGTNALNANTTAVNANIAAQQKAITSLTSMGGSGSSGGSSGGSGGTMADWNLRSAQVLYNAWYTSQKTTPTWQQQQDAWTQAQRDAAANNANPNLPFAVGQFNRAPAGTVFNPNPLTNTIGSAGSSIMGAVTGGTSTAISTASGSGSNFVIPQTGNTSAFGNYNSAMPLTTTANITLNLDGKVLSQSVNKIVGTALSQRGNMP